MYIDSHVHFWRLARGDYGWIKPDNRILYQDFTPEHLLPFLKEESVVGCIAVQAAPTIAETEYLLSLIDDHPWILGVVGSLDPYLVEAEYVLHYERLRVNRMFKGVRLNGDQLERIARYGGEALLRLKRWVKDKVTVDLLVRDHQLEHALTLLRFVPELHVVVNHLGCPPYGQEHLSEQWAQHMSALARYPNVMVKISGMITPAGNRPQVLRPYVTHLLDAYGPGRLMYGSDWPVAKQKGSYAEVVRLLTQVLPEGLTERELHAIRFGSACDFYGVSECQENNS